MPPRLWFARWKKACWLQTLVSGLTCDPSTPDPSLEPWIASWRHTPASPSAMPASGSAKTTPGTSGLPSAKSSALPPLPWSSLKMSVDICVEDSAASSLIFNQWVTKLGRDCSARRKWVRLTGASGCSPWPTATARDAKNPERSAAGMERKAETGWSIDLNTAAQMWPTPNVPNGGRTTNTTSEREDGSKRQVELAAIVENWQTPGTDSFRCRGGDRKDEMGLDQEVRNWSTPHGMMGHEADGRYGCGGEHAKQATNWQSPQTRDHRDGRINPETASKHLGTRPLNEEVLSWRTPTMRDHHPNTLENRTRNVPTVLLTHQVENWNTPTAQDAESAGSPKTTYLKQHVENWPSPATTDGASAARGTTTTGIMHPGTSLTDAIRSWPSPRAEDSEFCGNHPGAQDSLTGVIQDWSPPSTSLPTEPETGTAGNTCWCGARGCDQPSHRRKLNIFFDEWLMGWPLNWSSADTGSTGFAQWETDSARCLWQWLSAYSLKPLGLGNPGQMDLF